MFRNSPSRFRGLLAAVTGESAAISTGTAPIVEWPVGGTIVGGTIGGGGAMRYDGHVG